jgi:hypothetical protein
MSYYTAQSGFFDTLLGGLKTGAKTALDIQLEAARQAGASEAQIAAMQAQQAQQGGTPSWVLPVAIGGGALVLILLLKGGKKENPGRSRRRRR